MLLSVPFSTMSFDWFDTVQLAFWLTGGPRMLCPPESYCPVQFFATARPAVLFATIVFSRRGLVRIGQFCVHWLAPSPPPTTPALLLTIVQLRMSITWPTGTELKPMPPPSWPAEFPENVVLVIVASTSWENVTPPPTPLLTSSAWLPMNALSTIVTCAV